MKKGGGKGYEGRSSAEIWDTDMGKREKAELSGILPSESLFGNAN